MVGLRKGIKGLELIDWFGILTLVLGFLYFVFIAYKVVVLKQYG
jgi:hypothetical protein